MTDDPTSVVDEDEHLIYCSDDGCEWRKEYNNPLDATAYLQAYDIHYEREHQ